MARSVHMHAFLGPSFKNCIAWYRVLDILVNMIRHLGLKQLIQIFSVSIKTVDTMLFKITMSYVNLVLRISQHC